MERTSWKLLEGLELESYINGLEEKNRLLTTQLALYEEKNAQLIKCTEGLCQQNQLQGHAQLSSQLQKVTTNDNETNNCENEISLPILTLPAEILVFIVSFLDEASLLTTRLVCNTLNKAAITILSQKTNEAYQWLKLSPHQESNYKLKLQKFHNVFKSSGATHVFQKHLLLEFTERLLKLPESIIALQRYGTNFKTLKLHHVTITTTNFRSLLMDWCPNLEELSITQSEAVINIGNKISLDITSPLMIRKLTLDNNTCPIVSSRWIPSIMKSSPKLKFIKFVSIDQNVKNDFYKQLTKIPEITENLKELVLNVIHKNNIQHLMQVPFSSKLKSLTFEKRYVEKYEAGSETKKFLQKVGASLVSLNMKCLSFYSYHQESSSIGWAMQFPLMANLTEACIDFGVELNIKEFLQNTPNLRKLHFEKKINIDVIFSKSSCLEQDPHLNLRELTIVEPIQKINTVQQIRMGFPNLSKLFVTFVNQVEEEAEDLEQDDDDDVEIYDWIGEVFREISQMNLTHLKVTFDSSENGWDYVRDICTPFKLLQKNENLKRLAVFSNNRNPETFPSAWIPIVTEIPSLRYLELSNFVIEVEEVEHFTTSLETNGIVLLSSQN